MRNWTWEIRFRPRGNNYPGKCGENLDKFALIREEWNSLFYRGLLQPLHPYLWNVAFWKSFMNYVVPLFWSVSILGKILSPRSENSSFSLIFLVRDLRSLTPLPLARRGILELTGASTVTEQELVILCPVLCDLSHLYLWKMGRY